MPVIIGRDEANGDLGIAVEHKFLAIGSLVPWARAGIGAVATLGARINVSYGPRGLDLIQSGYTPHEVIDRLTQGDARADERQIGVVDASGRSWVFTGSGLASATDGWAGGGFGPNLVVFGHRLRGEMTVTAMAETYLGTAGPIWGRLLAALDSGMRHGGDIREARQHAAALLVVRQGGGRGGHDDRMIDLRVDNHSQPVEELHRLLDIQERLFLPSDAADLVRVDEDLARALQSKLAFIGDYSDSITGVYDAATRAALMKFAARENLDEHLRPDEYIAPRVLERLAINVRT